MQRFILTTLGVLALAAEARSDVAADPAAAINTETDALFHEAAQGDNIKMVMRILLCAEDCCHVMLLVGLSRGCDTVGTPLTNIGRILDRQQTHDQAIYVRVMAC